MAKKYDKSQINQNIRLIDHKKVWMTPDEFRFYEEICKGYDRPNFTGKDLFQDHFEVNDSGVIIFVKPPHKKYSSMEVYTFLVSLQVNQQLRLAQEQIQSLIREAEKKFQSKIKEIDDSKEELKSLKEEVERPTEKAVKANSKRGARPMMGLTEQENEKVAELLSGFKEKWHRVLLELDSLSDGTFDEDEASGRAAMCLITQGALLEDLASADLRSRALKRDIDFAKATAYAELKNNPPDGKKVTESALAQLVIKDDEVRRITKEQTEAEKDYKHLSNIYAMLKEAHITFRSIKKEYNG